MMADTEHLRTIKSFVRREGRISNAQSKVISRLNKLILPETQPIGSWKAVFQNDHPVCLEIGFGVGESLVKMALTEPDYNFVGVEVYQTGVAKLLQQIEAHQIQNIRVFCYDVVTLLNHIFPINGFQRIQIFFPDPWPKKRHHKRRLIQSHFLDLLVKRLKPQGLLHLATDWQPYAEQMMEVLENHPHFVNRFGAYAYAPTQFNQRPETKFERRGQKMEHTIYDLAFLAALTSEPSIKDEACTADEG